MSHLECDLPDSISGSIPVMQRHMACYMVCPIWSVTFPTAHPKAFLSHIDSTYYSVCGMVCPIWNVTSLTKSPKVSMSCEDITNRSLSGISNLGCELSDSTLKVSLSCKHIINCSLSLNGMSHMKRDLLDSNSESVPVARRHHKSLSM